MPVRCNHKGGFGLRIEDEQGRLVRYRLKHGINDIDAELVYGALKRMDQKLAEGLTSPQKDGSRPLIELDVELSDPDDGESGAKVMSAADKIELVKQAGSLAELRTLAEGDERKTVLAAIEKRAAELSDQE